MASQMTALIPASYVGVSVLIVYWCVKHIEVRSCSAAEDIELHVFPKLCIYSTTILSKIALTPFPASVFSSIALIIATLFVCKSFMNLRQ